ncbi:pirin family protein [Shewanella xiamenensis]|uniref:pirin family protein n=1 Tax=Shewanella xiamenensis TaxID=332186 RepID=UPI00313AC9DC
MSQMQTSPFYGGPRECPVENGRIQIQHIASKIGDVGGIPVARAIPQKPRRLIGPWCFLDHIGPVTNGPLMNVGEHPHIGLQTFTWMLEGEIMHRDSLGSTQVIRPKQVNLMTAGHGIAHTEESVEGHRTMHAVQLWIALPLEHKDTTPRFDHYPQLPTWQEAGAEFTLLIGSWKDKQAPTLHFSPIVALDIFATEATQLTLRLDPRFEYGLMPLEGRFDIDDESFDNNNLAYLGMLREGITLDLHQGARLLLIGGAPLTDTVSIWWNFVGHSKEDIASAQADWEAKSPRFTTVPGYSGKRLMPPPIPW